MVQLAARRGRHLLADAWSRQRPRLARLAGPALQAVNPLGRAVLVGALVSGALGWRYGWTELKALALLFGLSLLVGTLWTLGPMAYAARIELGRSRVTVGERAVGRVVVSPRGARSMIGTRFELPVGKGTGSFHVPALATGAEHEELFAIPARRRSVLTIGPVRSVKSDPLGLLQRVKQWSESVELFIHPRVVALNSTTTGFLRDVEGVTTQNLSSSDVAFHTLRDYVPGDDRRSIHWRTTARIGKLMVRQFEETQRAHHLIVLSQRMDDYATDEEFETAISVVASLATHALREERRVSVFTHDGELLFPTPQGLLDRLCRVERTSGADSITELVTSAVAAVPNASVATIVVGSTPGPAVLRASQLRIPLDIRSFAVRCSDAEAPARRQIATLVVLDIGTVDDLPRAIRTIR